MQLNVGSCRQMDSGVSAELEVVASGPYYQDAYQEEYELLLYQYEITCFRFKCVKTTCKNCLN